MDSRQKDLSVLQIDRSRKESLEPKGKTPWGPLLYVGAGVLFVLIVGVAFSGTLTYQELTGATALVCPSPGAPGTIFGYPACVYGLVMYIILAIVSGLGLVSESKRTATTH